MKKQNHTIVLVHGFGFDDSIWDPVDAAFAGYPVTRLSLPGFSDEPVPGPYSIEELANLYWDQLDYGANQLYHLAGHSMGGYVIMEMAAQFPDCIGSLALIHSHVYEDPADKKAKRDEAIASIQKEGHEAFASKMIGGMIGSEYKPKAKSLLHELTAKGVERGRDAWLHGIAAMRDRKDHSETLRRLDTPLLMIMGEEDGAIPLEYVYKQAADAARAELYVLPGVGHLGMYEKTEEVTDILRRFYENVIG